METTTFAISFLTRKCKGDKKKADIYATITVNGEQKELSVKEQISVPSWDNRKNMVIGNTIETRSINEHLGNIRQSIKDKYRNLLDDNKLVTAENVRNAYLGVQTELKGHKMLELLDYYKKIWEFKLKNGGFKNYKTTIKYEQLFLSHQFESGFATNFEHYIRTNSVKE